MCSGKDCLRDISSAIACSVYISCGRKLTEPHAGVIFRCVLIGSSAWRHSEGQGLVLVHVGEPEQFNRNVEDTFEGGM